MRDKGFTLIELMIVMAVIAVLATMSLFGLNQAQKAARDAQRQQTMSSVRSALERYFTDNQKYPTESAAATNWANTTAGVAGVATLLVTNNYLSALPTDPCPPGATVIADGGTVATCGVVKYWYDAKPDGCTNLAGSPCSSYILTLTKEAGGASTFSSPQ